MLLDASCIDGLTNRHSLRGFPTLPGKRLPAGAACSGLRLTTNTLLPRVVDRTPVGQNAHEPAIVLQVCGFMRLASDGPLRDRGAPRHSCSLVAIRTHCVDLALPPAERRRRRWGSDVHASSGLLMATGSSIRATRISWKRRAPRLPLPARRAGRCPMRAASWPCVGAGRRSANASSR